MDASGPLNAQLPSDLIATPQPAPTWLPQGVQRTTPADEVSSPLTSPLDAPRGQLQRDLKAPSRGISRKPLQGTLGVLGLAFHAQDASVFCLLFLHVVMKVLWGFFFHLLNIHL